MGPGQQREETCSDFTTNIKKGYSPFGFPAGNQAIRRNVESLKRRRIRVEDHFLLPEPIQFFNAVNIAGRTSKPLRCANEREVSHRWSAGNCERYWW